MNLNSNSIIKLSLLTEGALIIVYLIWQQQRQLSPIGPLTTNLILAGFFFTLPLFLVNYFLFGPFSKSFKPLAQFRQFKNSIVIPLVNSLNIPAALIISLLAGFGEELFFRGVIQTEFGILIASLLFSVLHFGKKTTDYLAIAFVYFIIGIYFGLLKDYSKGLWLPILSHSIYDFLIILFLKHRSQKLG